MRRLLLLLLVPLPLAAQVPRLSARAIAMAGAYTATARGFEAASWNPASLAAPGQPSFSLSLPSVLFEFGSNAYGLSDLLHYAGRTLSTADKNRLLGKVDTALATRTIAAGSPFGMSIGRFALTVNAFGDLDARLGKDAVTLALFGNAHRSGPGQFFTAAGSRADGWGAATIAASYAVPLRMPQGRATLGITVKRVLGLGLVRGAETSSQFLVNPSILVHGAGHVLYTRYAPGQRSPAGNGYGLDLGATFRYPSGLTLGAVIVNAFEGMTWKADRFQYDRLDYQLVEGADGRVIDTERKTTLIGAQIDTDVVARALRDSMLAHANFSRRVRFGATMTTGRWLLAAEGTFRLREGIDRQLRQSLVVATEVTFGFLALRAGLANDLGDGLDLSAGAGFQVGPLRLDLGGTIIRGTEHPGVRFGTGLSLMFGQASASRPAVVGSGQP